VVAGHDHAAAVITAAEPVLDGGRNVLVVVPTATECEMLLEPLREHFGSRALAVTSALGAAEVTRAWSLLAGYGGLLAVGTRELAMWPAGDIGLAVVIEEGRPAMKAKQTPTLHVRDVLRRRSAVERFDLLFRGPVPTLEILAAGVDVAAPSGRVWPLVEIVDRTQESPGSGVVGEGARAAVTAVAGRRGTVFVLVPRRGYAGAFACVQCGDIRRCPHCGAAAGRTAGCERCGEPLPAACKCGGTRFRPLGAGVGRVIDELRRSVGDSVGEVGSGSPVVVGTERDLVGVVGRDLAVAIDLDGRVLAPNYRAAEDALRLGARLAATVGSGGGRRCLIQTSIPDHPVMTALRTGRPMPFLGDELAAREKARLPPVGELIAIEVRGDHAGAADDVIRSAAADVAVRGPAVTGGEARWLLQGSDLRMTRVRLRNTVQTLRDGGLAVRVDADPVDL
jgi:primosomal protein N' (replication factor Y)